MARGEDPCPILLRGRSYDQYIAEGFSDALQLKPYIETARKIFSSHHQGLDLLEIGPGLHRIPIALKELGIITPSDELIEVDIIEDFLDVAPQWIERESSIHKLKADSVDFAYSLCVFQHLLPEERQFYAEQLLRVVRPGGLFFAQVPNAQATYYVEKPTLHRFNRAEIERLFPTSRWFYPHGIVEGNLSNYSLLEHPSDIQKEKREFFIIVQRR